MGLNQMCRTALATACFCLALLTAGCGEIKDIGEEMGWIEAPATPSSATFVTPSLDAHWLPADTTVADVSQAQWSARWWQWAARFPNVNELPYRDPDGRRCAQFQEDGPVWFLAGTDGNFDAVRSCTIPAGKHLFVPLINWVVARGLQEIPISCEEKAAQAAQMADHVTSALVLLDGRPLGELKRMRVASGGCFDSFSGSPPGATDGYWLMLKPLPPGKHQLAIAASYRDGPRQMLQNFRYELEVEGEAGGADATAGAVE
ncbi:MAG TPA: hypothetical protein VJ484_10235 [Lysobacter sp.]|nr:hypothetical protein [Lysobacter sp.]